MQCDRPLHKVFSNNQLPFVIYITFMKLDVLSLFLLRFGPKDLMEFLKASVVGEFISNYYFYSSVN